MISKSILLERGETVDWMVSAPDYLSQEGEYTMGDTDYTETVILQSGHEEYTVTIVTDPQNQVVINGLERTTATFPSGTLVQWSVSRTSYQTVSDQFYINSNRTIEVELYPETVTFTIQTLLDNTVTINGVVQRSVSVPYNSEVVWSVTREHYQPQSGSQIVTQDTTIAVGLQPDTYTFQIETSELNTVVINEESVRTVALPYNSEVSYSVSRAGYITQSDTFNLVSDTVLPITLVKEQCTLTINTANTNYCIMDGEFQTVVGGQQGTRVSWKVSAPGKVTQSGTHTLVGDDVLNINLVNDSGPNYLRFDILEDGYIEWGKCGGNPLSQRIIEYSVNGSEWYNTTLNIEDRHSIPVNLGDTVLFKGANESYCDWDYQTDDLIGYYGFGGTDAKFDVSGNIMSLINANFENLVRFDYTAALAYLFEDTYVRDASKLSLPATTLTNRVYHRMFADCPYLTQAPQLPALNLQYYCYAFMFVNDQNLLQSPDLDAMTLPEGCYRMMFYGCTRLNYIRCMATGTETTGIYPDLNRATENWVNSISPSGLFVCDQAAMGWIRGASGIPAGWTTRAENTGRFTFAISADHSSPTGVDSSLDTATITISGVQRKYMTNLANSNITWSVVKSGFPTESGTYVLTQNHNEIIQMNKYTLTVSPTPSDATVVLTYGGQSYVSNTAYVDPGTVVGWECSKSGYRTISGVETVNSNTTLTPTLIEEHTITIQPMPEIVSDATVVLTVNGQSYTQNYWTDVPGTVVNYTVSKSPYTPVSGSVTIGNSDQTVQVPLQTSFTFTIQANSNDRIVIDGVVSSGPEASKQVAYGQTVQYRVYRRGYFPVEGSSTLTSDVTLPVTLTAVTSTVNDYLTIYTEAMGSQPSFNYKLKYGYVKSTGTAGTPRTIEYSLNGGTWTSITPQTEVSSGYVYSYINVREGDVVQLRGDNASYADQDLSGNMDRNHSFFTCEMIHYVCGNIMSLIDSTNFSSLTTLTSPRAFRGLFERSTIYSSSSLRNGGILLPATTLTQYCYAGLFSGNSTFQNGGVSLPATVVPNNAYQQMFKGTSCGIYGAYAPFSATTVGNYGMYEMYANCGIESYCYFNLNSIVSCGEYALASMFTNTTIYQSSDLSRVVTMGQHAFDKMYYNCTVLKTVSELPIPTANYVFMSMFENCGNEELGYMQVPDFDYMNSVTSGCFSNTFKDCMTLNTAPKLPIATSMASYCYEHMFDGSGITDIPSMAHITTSANGSFDSMYANCLELEYVYGTSMPQDTPAQSAYVDMFKGCSNLLEVELPATSAGFNAYAGIFENCSSLQHLRCMLTAYDRYVVSGWVHGVQTTAGVFYKNPSATWDTRGENGVPWNWTIVDYVP